MNNQKTGVPHPLVVYLWMLLVAVVVSWICCVYEMRRIQLNSDIILRSVLDGQGLRWLVRNAVSSISSAPVGNSLLILSGAGIVYGSGIWNSIARMFKSPNLSYKERVGLVMAAVVLLMYLAMIIAGLFFGHRVLLGQTGTIADSPFADGAILMLFFLVALPSMVYGFAVGTLRNSDNVVDALTAMFKLCASFYITMMTGSLLLAVFDYTGLDMLLGVGNGGMRVLRFLIWWLPLPWILLRNKSIK